MRVCDFTPPFLFHLVNCLSFVLCYIKRQLSPENKDGEKKKKKVRLTDWAIRTGWLGRKANNLDKRRLSAITALTYSGLLDVPCFLLITSSLLPSQLFTLSVHKVMTQDVRSLSTHSLILLSSSHVHSPCVYHTPTMLSTFRVFSTLQKVYGDSPDFWGEVGWLMPGANSGLLPRKVLFSEL